MSTIPRVLCIGANLESEVALRKLLAIQANVVGLVSQPVQLSNTISDYVDLHPFCMAHALPVIDTVDINSAATLAHIADLKPDYIFTLGWSRLFKAPLLQLPTGYVVGSHPSPLPKGRGRAPVPWTLLQGETRSAVSLFRMDAGIDSGPLLHQRWFDIPADAYALELYQLVAENLGQAFCELYAWLCAGTVTETPQDMSQATFRAKRTPADGHLDFRQPAAAIECLVRAVSTPYPGAYTYYHHQLVRIWAASLNDVPPYYGVPGQIVAQHQERLLVQAGDHPLWLWKFTNSDNIPVPMQTFSVGSKMGYALEDEIHLLHQEIKALKQLLQR